MRLAPLALAVVTSLPALALWPRPAAADDPPPAPVGEDTPEALGRLFVAIRTAVDAGDTARAVALTRALVPSADELAQVLVEGVDPAVKGKIAEGLAIPPQAPAERVARFLVPGEGRTEVVVHSATVAELKAYAPGTIAQGEFPGGAQRLAALLRPDERRFHEVVVRRPGEQAGTKYHLFFWSGTGWRMLGPAWRALPR